MKIEIREDSIELIPQTEHEWEAIEKIRKNGISGHHDGRKVDRNWEPAHTLIIDLGNSRFHKL